MKISKSKVDGWVDGGGVGWAEGLQENENRHARTQNCFVASGFGEAAGRPPYAFAMMRGWVGYGLPGDCLRGDGWLADQTRAHSR